MTVHFVYRSHYHGPTGLYVKRFDEPSILDWFRNRWRGVRYDAGAHRYAEELLGTHIYGFASLVDRIAEHSLPPPRSNPALREVLEEHLYVEGEVLFSPHLMQVLTDDDEIQLAYYFFDDEYLAKHGKRAALLLHEGWQLPAEAGEGGFRPADKTTSIGKVRGEGTTYLVVHDFWDGSNLTDTLEGGYRIDGIRLPQLTQYLVRHELPDVGCSLHYDTEALRPQLLPKGKKAKAPEEPFLFAIREHPEDDAPWLIVSDYLAERGRGSAGAFVLERALREVSRHVPEDLSGGVRSGAKKSLIQVEEHVAVMCRHVDRWDDRDMYHQWYFFDDLWASAHPDLANAILRYARRWHVL
jgi:uncharacterized protein (TIGR02996 family)